jgi:hypothetical protein
MEQLETREAGTYTENMEVWSSLTRNSKAKNSLTRKSLTRN